MRHELVSFRTSPYLAGPAHPPIFPNNKKAAKIEVPVSLTTERRLREDKEIRDRRDWSHRKLAEVIEATKLLSQRMSGHLLNAH